MLYFKEILFVNNKKKYLIMQKKKRFRVTIKGTETK